MREKGIFVAATRRAVRCLPTLIWLAALPACRPPQEMANQPRYDALAEDDRNASGSSALPPPPGAIARGQLENFALLPKGPPDQLAPGYPFELTRADRVRGKERFLIFCSPCHGEMGRADGEVVRRGFPKPPDYLAPDLEPRPPAYFVDIATRGAGRMPSYAAQVPLPDRWRIAAYIKDLQRAQSAAGGQTP